MNEVFADAGYWIALLNPKDDKHESAQRATKKLGERKIVTTEMVLVEVFAHVSKEGAFARNGAVEMLDGIRNNPNVEIVPQTHEQFEAAARRYAECSDQRWSLTDCASFLEMEKRAIFEALAHDRDFERAGFVALMRNA